MILQNILQEMYYIYICILESSGHASRGLDSSRAPQLLYNAGRRLKFLFLFYYVSLRQVSHTVGLHLVTCCKSFHIIVEKHKRSYTLRGNPSQSRNKYAKIIRSYTSEATVPRLCDPPTFGSESGYVSGCVCIRLPQDAVLVRVLHA